MQTSAVIDPSEQSTVMSPDGKVSVAFQKSSRQSTYQVLVDSSPDNCAGGDQIDGMVYACLTVEVFDAQGDPESGVTLINSASGRIVLSPEEVEELGGLGVLFQTNVLGGLSVVTRDSASDMWTPLTHGLEAMDGGGAAITLSSFRTLGNFALVIDETVRQQALYQVTGAPTPTSVPTPMATATAVPTPTPMATATAVPTPTPTATATAVPTPTPMATATAVPTPTPMATATMVPTAAPTATPISTEVPPTVGGPTLPGGLLLALILGAGLLLLTGARILRGRQ
jgi:hypothetical protein